jgi:superfamily II DNA/RNA helicase
MKQFVDNPVIISVKNQPTPENVNQDIVKLNGRDKIDVLDELLTGRGFEKVLVFGRTKRGIDRIASALIKRRVAVATIHGNKTQGQRQKALELFKSNKVQVLLATDIASRGLDIKDVTHVINYDLPETYEDYIHRIGRTGRANKKGNALTFV